MTELSDDDWLLLWDISVQIKRQRLVTREWLGLQHAERVASLIERDLVWEVEGYLVPSPSGYDHIETETKAGAAS